MLPNFLIIGAPRSGTTWMARNLRQHPDIYMPRKKELHFFDAHYEKGIEYYEAFFEARDQESAVGEATPAYLHGLYTDYDVPMLIRKHLSSAKLIACLRNPVDRAYSRYCNAKAKFPAYADSSFEDMLESVPELIEEGFYYDQIMRYYDRFPSDQILLLLFDDLKSNPTGFLRGIFLYLRVDPDFVSPLTEVRASASSSKRRMGRFRTLSYLHRGLIRIEAFKTASVVAKWNRIEVPPMKSDTRRQLVEVYRNQNLKLQDLMGRDLSEWNRVY